MIVLANPNRNIVGKQQKGWKRSCFGTGRYGSIFTGKIHNAKFRASLPVFELPSPLRKFLSKTSFPSSTECTKASPPCLILPARSFSSTTMNFLPNTDEDLAAAILLSQTSSASSSASSSSSSDAANTSTSGGTSTNNENKSDTNPSTGKRQKTSSNNLLNLQPPGFSNVLTLPGFVHTDGRHFSPIQVEHGSALSLISRGTAILNEEFSQIDPGKNWKKWTKMGVQPYFLAVVRPNAHANFGRLDILSILSFVMDGDVESGQVLCNDTPGHRSRRIVIDYVCTPQAHQGKGYASRLLNLVTGVATRHRANMFVLSLEESCPYWMNKGFVLEPGDINKRLNKFPDCHLLKQPSNLLDDFTIPPSSEEEEEDDDDDDDEEEEEDDEVINLRNAIAASLGTASTNGTSGTVVDLTNANGGNKGGDALAQAIAASMKEDDDTTLQRAIAASISMNQ
jgi:hypothetical protein